MNGQREPFSHMGNALGNIRGVARGGLPTLKRDLEIWLARVLMRARMWACNLTVKFPLGVVLASVQT